MINLNKIQHGLPLPVPTNGNTFRGYGRWQRVIRQMQPGDSVFLENKSQRNAFCNAAKQMKRKVTSCAEETGYRCWVVNGGKA